MSINERCEAEKISSLVQQHVPKAKLARQHEAELTFTLPFESMDTFSGQTLGLYVSGLCQHWCYLEKSHIYSQFCPFSLFRITGSNLEFCFEVNSSRPASNTN